MPGARAVSAGSAQTPFWAALVAAGLSFLLLPPLVAAFSALVAGLAIWIAVVDIRRLIIPDLAVAAMAALGLGLVAAETPPPALLQEVSNALMRAVVAGACLFLLRLGFRRLAGREGLGLGDVKLMAAGATLLSWPALPYALVLAAVAAIMVVILRGLRQGAWLARDTEIPFGAFLAPAIWAAFLIERLSLL
jgi:leader peptidase (prepilin peptidase)/N-methyltransferase